MEKFKTHEVKVDEKNVIFYSWRFTKDERDSLKTALSKFPEEKVEKFIDDLEMVCLCAMNYLNERNITFQRSERKRALGRFEKAEAELYNLIDKRRDPKLNVLLKEKTSLMDFSIYQDDTVILEKQRLHYLMLTAATQLKEIIAIIKEEHSGIPGRPSADTATGKLVKIIACVFNNFFEKPTGHKLAGKPERQPFFSIVQIALEACNLPYKDPSRHIKEAINNL